MCRRMRRRTAARKTATTSEAAAARSARLGRLTPSAAAGGRRTPWLCSLLRSGPCVMPCLPVNRHDCL